MFPTFINQKYGNTIYPTILVKSSPSGNTMNFGPNINDELRDFIRYHKKTILNIVLNNPRVVEYVVLEDQSLFLTTERVRNDDKIYYVIQLVFTINSAYQNTFRFYNLHNFFYSNFVFPTQDKICSASKELLEYVTKNKAKNDFIFNFLFKEYNRPFKYQQTNYFYDIKDAVSYITDAYFTDTKTTSNIKVINSDSNLYISTDLNHFSFLIINAFIFLIRYSLRNIEVEFKNSVTNLEIHMKTYMHNAFYQDNENINLSDRCRLSPEHPAFFEFCFIEHMVKSIGANVKLEYLKNGKMDLCIYTSKVDIALDGLLKASIVGINTVELPIYTVSLEDIIKKNN